MYEGKKAGREEEGRKAEGGRKKGKIRMKRWGRQERGEAQRERERVRGEGGIKHQRVHHGMTSATKPTTFSELKLSHSFLPFHAPEAGADGQFHGAEKKM